MGNCGACGGGTAGEHCNPCYYSCTGSCSGGCDGGCKSCKGTCTAGCKVTCTSCKGCTNACTGCKSCTGCDGCDGCSGSCDGACNSGCSGGAAAQAFEALRLGLNDYITEQDLNNIYLIFEAVKNRRADAGISTAFTKLSFNKDIQSITADTIQKLSQNATNIGFAITNNNIIQNEKFLKNTAEELRTKALQAYQKVYGR